MKAWATYLLYRLEAIRSYSGYTQAVSGGS